MNGAFELKSELTEELLKVYQDRLESEDDRKLFANVGTSELASIIESAIIASLTREEGNLHDFELVIGPCPAVVAEPDYSATLKPYLFKNPPKLKYLAKLASVVSYTNRALNVWFDSENQAVIWGYGESIPNALVLRTVNPGTLVIKLPIDLFSTTDTFVVGLEDCGFVDASKRPWRTLSSAQEDVSYLLEQLQPNNRSPQSPDHNERMATQFYRLALRPEFLSKLVNEIRRTHRGGTLIVLPDDNDWTRVMELPIPLQPDDPFRLVQEQLQADERQFVESVKGERKSWFERNQFPSPTPSLEVIARATSVDGAVVVTKEFAMLAFGVKLSTRNSSDRSLEVQLRSPLEGRDGEVVSVDKLGGTRHQSAAQYIYDRRDASAIVISEDGPVSVMFWDETVGRVCVLTHAEYLFA